MTTPTTTTLRRAGLVAAAAAVAATMGIGSASAASSLDMPTSTSIYNGLVSVACQHVPVSSVDQCGQFDDNNSDAPVMLSLNPLTTDIVILGAGLYADGTMREYLLQRLRAGLALANQFPTAPIIVTGGNPQNGITEASAMYTWLVSQGVDPGRITQDGQATDTIGNARYSDQIMQAQGATGAVIVTTPDHVVRAVKDFRQQVAGRIPVTGYVAQ